MSGLTHASSRFGLPRPALGFLGKGNTMSRDTSEKALSRVEVNPGFPADLKPYMQEQAEILLKARIISAIPDRNKALRPDFMEPARAGT
jgi:NitT/TauT family transport system substrate-binding protein